MRKAGGGRWLRRERHSSSRHPHARTHFERCRTLALIRRRSFRPPAEAPALRPAATPPRPSESVFASPAKSLVAPLHSSPLQSTPVQSSPVQTSEMFLFELALCAVMAIAVVVKLQRNRVREMVDKFDGPPAWPFLGNILTFLGSPTGKCAKSRIVRPSVSKGG